MFICTVEKSFCCTYISCQEPFKTTSLRLVWCWFGLFHIVRPIFIFKKWPPWWDSISRFLAPISPTQGGDDYISDTFFNKMERHRDARNSKPLKVGIKCHSLTRLLRFQCFSTAFWRASPYTTVTWERKVAARQRMVHRAPVEHNRLVHMSFSAADCCSTYTDQGDQITFLRQNTPKNSPNQNISKSIHTHNFFY
jgi:hypothetical protein